MYRAWFLRPWNRGESIILVFTFKSRKAYKLSPCGLGMETVTIAKDEYERLKELEQIDFDLVRQFVSSKEDLKQGRFKNLA